MFKKDFYIYQEDLIRYKPYKDDVSISEMVCELNKQFVSSNMKKLRVERVIDFLIVKGILSLEEDNIKVPTSKGKLIGLSIKEKINSNNEKYSYIAYDKAAQQYLLDHLYDVLYK
ncbi:hypothetical protein [Lacrimispora sp.]|uniref:hypothetical protein n=1 Tax=Lacrimispora sp. TaxID=2719234 RepID=UPI0028AA7F68|nr:hypothetical protein [Lacrimispora sp.]